jgi:antitoxin PrlF
METTLTSKGQVTIPKHIRDALGLKPGDRMVFDADEAGNVFLRKEGRCQERRPDRFDRALGSAEIKWDGTTDEYMAFIRGDD